ncbi:hypothetical protein LDENG_00152980 [Lucifuga dentata]|nr:hypothetical protein LDENG_00152980 [Lucifuga dentata]
MMIFWRPPKGAPFHQVYGHSQCHMFWKIALAIYLYNTTVMNNKEINSKGVILQAFDQFRIKSCIDFKLWDSEKYYLSIQIGNGCASYIGRLMEDGQPLFIGPNCDVVSIVEHEFLHALGFIHEQSRYDRDDYVTTVFENIMEEVGSIILTKFHKKYKAPKESCMECRSPVGVYFSVMHYGQNDFSNGNGSTIITNDPKYQDVIGQRLEVSPSDVLKLNRLYECNSTIAFKFHCSFSYDVQHESLFKHRQWLGNGTICLWRPLL